MASLFGERMRLARGRRYKVCKKYIDVNKENKSTPTGIRKLQQKYTDIDQVPEIFFFILKSK